jgi:hypothetical protein
MLDLREVWLRHVRADRVVAFPRDYNLKRLKLRSREHYLTVCSLAHRNRLELYTSVYSDYEVENGIVTTLFYDIDSEGDPVELIADLEPLLRVTRSVYSGRRGVHVYVDIPPVRVRDLRAVAESVAEILGISDLVDRHVLGDWRRIARVPGSYHSKTDHECVVINPETHPDLSREIAGLISERFLSRTRSYSAPMSRDVREVVSVVGDPPPCIEYLVARLRSGDNLPHMARLHLGAYLMLSGLTPEEASVLFVTSPDYDPRVTLYQLSYIQRRRYRMLCCHKAIEFGICPLPLNRCRFYPTPNRFFR